MSSIAIARQVILDSESKLLECKIAALNLEILAVQVLQDCITIHCQDRLHANILRDKWRSLVGIIVEATGQKLPAFVYWNNCTAPYKIPTGMLLAHLDKQKASIEKILPPSNEAIAPSKQEVEAATDAELMSWISSASVSCAIARASDSKLLAASFEIASTNGKSYADAIGESVLPLWDEQELQSKILTPLRKEGSIIDCCYWSYKWVWDGNAWMRSRQDLVGNFYARTFAGVPCRISYNVRSR